MAGAGSKDIRAAALRPPTLAAVFALGFSCVVTQLALMREMLGAFAGNELVLGVALGNWLLLMGVGASLGRVVSRRLPMPGVLGGLLICTALLPPVQVVALRSLREIVFLRGEAIGVVGTVLVSFGLLLPYCLAAGMSLALACAMLEGRGAAAGAGQVYTMDSLGSMAGGLLFSFLLVLFFDHIALLAVPALLNLLAAGWLAWRNPLAAGSLAALRILALPVAGAVVLGWILSSDPDATSTARQVPGQRVLFRGNSPYGRLLVTESAQQTNIIENGVVLVSTPNIELAEESVHFALAQRPSAKRVLLLGGALSGAPREILRYGVTAVDCLELDPLIVSLAHRFMPADLNDSRLRLVQADARQFVRQAAPGYDVIIVALPDPATAQLNRFFTLEFFQEARRILRPGGVLSFAVGRYENYASLDLSHLLSCTRQTASQVFQNVSLVPGGRVYFLASDGPLTADIARELEQAGVTTRWVNRGYLAAMLAPDRLADLARAASQPASLNHDFTPVLYYLHLRHWASQFEGVARWLTILLVMAGIVYMARLGGAAGVIFASGFAGASLEIVLLLGMQILAGSVYQQLAWVITLFMAGLATGAWLATRRIEKALPASGLVRRLGRHNPQAVLCLIAVALATAAGLLPFLLPLLSTLAGSLPGHTLSQGVLLLFTFGLATMVGAEFPLANVLASPPLRKSVQDETRPGHVAARLYTADFVGASLGALLAAVWLVPLAGLSGVCWITAALNVAAVLVLLAKKESP